MENYNIVYWGYILGIYIWIVENKMELLYWKLWLGPNIRIPMIIPIRGRRVVNHGSGLQGPKRRPTTTRGLPAPSMSELLHPLSLEVPSVADIIT